MPIIGNLSEFPLPEVLILIGSRTGTLRLYDVPEFGIMDIDFSNGEVQAMTLGNQTLTALMDIIAKLSAVVQTGMGMFEFRIHPVSSVLREEPAMINRLVISLVYHVDEQLKQQTTLLPDSWYLMETHQPDIWMEPELHVFLSQAQPHLVAGVHLEELAKCLKLDVSQTYQKLTSLCQLGSVRLVDGAEIEQARQRVIQQQLSQKSSQFQMAAEATDLIRRTGKLLKIMKDSPRSGA
jgi:hypothetical protein